MALLGFDSGEATRYPTYTTNPTAGWVKIANQPSQWEVNLIYTDNGAGGAGVQTTTKYSGTTAFRVTGYTGSNWGAMRRTFSAAALSESYVSLMFTVDSLSKDILTLSDAAMATQVRVYMSATGQILVYAGATLKQTITTGWAANEWHSLQVHHKVSDNTLEVKLDGVLTDCSGTTTAAWFYLTLGRSSAWTLAGSVYADCIQVNDVSGSVNNSWPGSPKILTAQRPSVDTAVTDWTRDGGSNDFDRIKEVSPDLDTTYVYSQLDGDTSTYGIGAISEPANAVIVGVCLTAVAKRADAAFLIPVISRGGVTPNLTAIEKAVGSDYMAPIEWFFETDPITGIAWTQTDLNATEFGFKHSIT